MNIPAISLIIPVYNLEKYLEKALRSVEDQTFKDVEVIIVDDGSTDNSVKIIEKFCKKNSNFKLIIQKNNGPGAARNTGISICTGRYIAFMDGDDYLEPKFLEILYNAAIKYQADVVCCNFSMYFPKQDLKISLPFNSLPGVYTKTQALKKLILDIGTHYFVWNKLSKREIFLDNNLKFENMYFEDISTSPKIFYHANKIVLLGDSLYNYVWREKSILHSINTEKINDFIKSIGIMREFFESEGAYKDYSNHLWIYAQKSKIVVYYYIVNLHARSMTFKGFMENISSATKSIDYFISKEFNLKSPLEVPYPIKSPEKKVKIKKKSKNSMWKK